MSQILNKPSVLGNVVDTWHQSSDSKNRFYFANGGRTYFGSANGYEFRSASDGTIAQIDNYGNLILSGIVIPGGADGLGAIGSYALLGYINQGIVYEGNIIPGNALRYANTYQNGNDAGWRESAPAGAWKAMGACGFYYNGGYGSSTAKTVMTSLFVRTS